METTLNQRLKIFVGYKNLSNLELAELLKVTPTSISSYLNGHSTPKNSTLSALFKAYPDLNRSWLMVGEGEMISTPGKFKEKDETSKLTYAAFKHLQDEVLYLRRLLEIAIGNPANFPNSPLQVGKILSINEGTFAGDYGLAQVG